MKDKLLEQMLTMFSAALAFVAALAWNNAVQGLFDTLYVLEKEGVIARFLYAIMITAFVVLLTTILRNLYNHDD
ncbi:DUF5654 family protein [Orenia marismortui]|uniref:DUF5654 family protein n=1 Tax=Orenia marismortui TaxID=46469 RepID=UPI00037CF638|nr:DUF5654 family protein [Orenia marismortui]